MKKVVCLILAVLMLCSLAMVVFAATPRRWSVIDNTYASATRTLIDASMGTQRNADLYIKAQVYRYSQTSDAYIRSVKFEESATDDYYLELSEKYTLYQKDKVVFTFDADGEIHTVTCYVK